MTQPSDPPDDEQGRPRDPGPPPPPGPRPDQPADTTRSDIPPTTGSTAYGSQQSRPGDQPAFGPQYAYQYGQQYGGTAPPAWPTEAPTQARNGIGVAALILGILAVILAIIPIIHFFAMLLGLIAIILGIVGLSRARRRIASNRAMPIIGIVLGILSLLIGAFWTYWVVVGARYTNDCLDANPGASDQVIEQCISDRFEERFGVDLRPG
jgi:uncharacterized protein YneF (UPF0154 family)